MRLLEAIEKRTSVRSFKDEAVSVNDVREMVRRAGLAPSINNFQPWEFILITDKALLNELGAMVSEKYKNFPFKNSDTAKNVKSQVEWYSTFFTSAPALIAVILTGYESVLERGANLGHDEINEMRNHPDIQGAGACIQNLLLSAVDLGYGACWLSGPMIAKKEIEEKLGIQDSAELLSFVAIGKPSKDFQPKKKEDLGKKMKVI